MKKQFLQLVVLIVVITLSLCACGTTEKIENVETTLSTEAVIETTESEIDPDPEWLSDTAIDEAYACLFPLEGEKDIELAQEILLPLVEAGNAEAQYYWGYIYDWEIVDNNGQEEKESLYWYELAVGQGFPKAYLAAALNAYVEPEQATELVELAKQAGLFEMSPEELGADGCETIAAYYYNNKDYDTALEWYIKAADMGCSISPMIIGHMYYDGAGVEQDIGTSMDWYLEASNCGNVYAMNYYGFNYFALDYINEIINQKYDSADKYQEDAKAGDLIAMHNLGQMYQHGLGGLKCDDKAALSWYLKAATAGDPNSMYRAGYMYHYGLGAEKDLNAALEWYLKAADLGNADAMNALGLMYSQGEGVDRDDKQANLWWHKGTNAQKNPENNDDRYINYFSEVTASKKLALDLIQKAADSGYDIAMINLGYYGYEMGYLEFDQGTAREWYKKAADEGSAEGMAYLGYNYYNKCNDYDSSMEWLVKAYANGLQDVIVDIEYMLSKKQGVNAYFEHYGELISAN